MDRLSLAYLVIALSLTAAALLLFNVILRRRRARLMMARGKRIDILRR